MSYEEAKEYIRSLLDNWTSWKEHHKALTEALEVIMAYIDEEEAK